MKAYRLHEFAGPDAIRLEELPPPTPGHGEVLVRIRAVSLNYRDLIISRGVYNPRLRLPLIPLSDGAGEVAVTGAGVTRFKPGDRVAASFMPNWVGGQLDDTKARSALGGDRNGVLAEEIVLPEEGLVAIPEHLGFEEAATLPCAAVTAWHALVVGGSIKPGDTILTLGTGGVSIFAIQFARMAGSRVIATSSQDDKLERLRDLGASELINYKTTPEWDKTVRELTQGVGADQIVEVGGAGTLPRSLHDPTGRLHCLNRRALRPGRGQSDADPHEERSGSGHLRRLTLHVRGDESSDLGQPPAPLDRPRLRVLRGRRGAQTLGEPQPLRQGGGSGLRSLISPDCRPRICQVTGSRIPVKPRGSGSGPRGDRNTGSGALWR